MNKTTYHIGGSHVTWTEPLTNYYTTTNSAICPDLLRYSQIGTADGWRGRVVRGFFWLLRVWPARG